MILNETQAKAWLGPDLQNLEKLESFLAPYEGKDLATYQVGLMVNSVKNTDKECLDPAA